METLQKRTKSMTVVIVKMMTLPNDDTSWSELKEKKRIIDFFHQADLNEIQVINKNIKG